MTRRAVRHDRKDGRIYILREIDEDEIQDDGGDLLVAHLSQIEDVSATSYRNALWHGGVEPDDRTLGISDVDINEFDPEYAPINAARLLVRDGELLAEIDFWLDKYEDDEEAVHTRVARSLAAILARQGARLVAVEPAPHFASAPWLWTLSIAPRARGRTLGEIYRDASDVETLLSAMHGGALTRESTFELLLAGRPDVLVGQPEGDWLDVKRQDYDLTSEAGKISLAQDVARFANAEYGGIVVVGLRATKRPTGETISHLTPVPTNPTGTRRHRQAIDNRVFPPPDFLDVREVKVAGGAIIVIHVPPQPEELKPFLVHGALVGVNGEGSFISIVRRRGEESIPITAPMIHSTLAAGRALLRRQPAPNAGDV